MPLTGWRVPLPLLALIGQKKPVLAQLARVLRAQKGSLRWLGNVSWPDSSWLAGVPETVADQVAAHALGSAPPLSALRLLPSEERACRAFEGELRRWRQGTSGWQLVVPGEPAWGEGDAAAWKQALEHVIGALLFLIWRYSRIGAALAAAQARLRRRLAFAIDSRSRIR